MCLNRNRRETEKYHAKTKPIVAWKVIAVKRYNGKVFSLSPFVMGFGFLWKEGLNQSSRLSVVDCYCTTRNSGFHCFLRRKDARNLVKSMINTNKWNLNYSQNDGYKYRVIKVLIEPKDVIMAGTWEYALNLYNPKNIQATQVTVPHLPTR